jgi:hypothetical protein
MYHEARKAGVHLLPWDALRRDFRADLTPAESTIRDFNAYLQEAQTGTAPVEELHQRHMALYHSYRFKRRRQFTASAPYVSASEVDRGFMAKTQHALIQRLNSLGQGDALAEGFDPAQAAKQAQTKRQAAGLTSNHKDQQLLAVAQRINPSKITPAVEAFFDGYLHDSMAGFMHQSMDEFKLNGMGLAKFRTVFKGND